MSTSADLPGMTLVRDTLAGRRGWTAVVSLTTLLGALTLGQLPAANADAASAPVAVTPKVAASGPLSLPAVAQALQVLLALPAPAPPPPPPPPPPPAAPVVRAAAVKPPAAAPADGLCSGAGWEQRRGEAALASLRAGAARTGFTVAFQPARSGYMGLTHLNENRIDMYVRSCAKQSTELLRHVMAHELGHAWDTNRMSDAQRAAYKQARGIPAGTPWYGCSSCTDFATPAGDFAEVYAQWARGASTNRSEIAGDVGPAQLSALAGQFFGA